MDTTRRGPPAPGRSAIVSSADNSGDTWDLVILGARRLDEEATADIGIRDGRIAAIEPSLSGHARERLDARGGLVTRSFVEPHFHLDKVLSRDLFGAVRPEDAFARARDVKKQFTVADVEDRACRALRLAVAHGIGCLQAQIDVDFATKLVSFEGVMRARERFAGAIDVIPLAFPQEGVVTDPEAPALLREALTMGAQAIGGLPEFERSIEDQQTHIDTLLSLAEEFDVPAEIHCDYLDVPELKTLEMLADATIDRGMQGRVSASHCNALAVYPDDEARRVIDKVVAAEMNIIVAPTANLEMLGGPGRTPVSRGTSRIKELLDAGVNACAAADNMYDIWYRFTRMDPVELGYITVLSGAMRTDEEVRESFEMVTTRAARAVGASTDGVTLGAPADLVVFEAATLVDIFRNLPGRRSHIKAGRSVGGREGSVWAIA